MDSKTYVLGVDLGGTNTKIGLVNSEGEVLTQKKLKTSAYPNIDRFVDALASACDVLLSFLPKGAVAMGIGIGAPNASALTGNIEFAPNLPWKGVVPLAAMLSDCIQLPVYIINDAKAAALGESRFGVARDLTDFIMITLGTGIGSGLFVRGNLVSGTKGFAGELGHMTVIPDGRLCGCGRRGCLETYASATGLVRTAIERLQQGNTASSLSEINPEQMTSYEVFKAAEAGDAVAGEVFERTGEILGKALSNMVLATDPQAIVMFGGLLKSGKWLLDPVRKHFEANLMHVYQNRIPVLTSSLDDANAAILGAAALVWENQGRPPIWEKK